MPASSKNAALVAVLLAVLTTLLWAGNAVMARGLGAELPPIGLAFWRWALASLVLMPFAIMPLWRDRAEIRRHFWILVLLAIPGVSFYNTFVYIALQTSPVANTTMMMCATPAFILILSRIFFKEAIQFRDMLGIAASFLGVAILLTRGDLTALTGLSFGGGELWAIAAAVSWACYSVLLRKRPASIGQRSFVLFTFVFGSLSLLPFAILEHQGGRPMPTDMTGIIAVLYVALFASIAAYLMWNRAVATLGPNQAGAMLYLFPVFSSIGGAAILGEGLELYHGFGIAAVLVGIWLLVIEKLRRG